MAKRNSTAKKTSAPVVTIQPARKLDAYFEQYAQTHQSPVNKVLGVITAIFCFFFLTGITWWLPFPHLTFLGSLSSSFSWASPFIGFSIYFYYRQSPVLSYVMLLVVFGFSYVVSQAGSAIIGGGSPIWQMYLQVFVFSMVVQVAGYFFESKKPTAYNSILFLWIGPVYWLHRIFKKLGWKY